MKNAQYRKLNDRSQNSSTYHKKDGTAVRAILKEESQKEIDDVQRVEKVSCPVCKARFRWEHVCRKMRHHPCVTREWALNPPKKYRK